MKKLAKAMSAFLVICMLMATMTAVTYAAEVVRYSLSLSGPITVRGEPATISVLKETVNDITKTHSAATVVNGVTFTSSDENVLTIGENGKINAKKVGTATIKATGDGLPTTLHMLAIVTLEGPDANTVVNFDDKTPGDYTRSTNSQQATSIYLDLPHKIVTAPAFGGKGNALYLTALNPTDFANKGWATGANWAEYPLFHSAADESDKTIVPGKISQFWWYYPEYSVRNNWYIQMYLPSGNYAKIKLHNLNANYPLHLARIENFDNRGTAVFSKGNSSCNWGGEYAYLNYGWNQVTIDASSVDPVTGNGAYNIYINSDKVGVFTENTGNKNGRGTIVFNRELNFAATLTSSPAYFDNFGIYELVLPEIVSNTVTVGEHGSVTFSGTKCATGTSTVEGLTSGGTADFTITPENGYEVDSISYNGTALAADATSVTVVKGATLAVSFKKAGATNVAIPDGTYYSMATDGDVKIGQSTKVMLLEEVVSGGQATVTEKSGVTFTSSDTTIAEIVDGKIVGKKPGLVKISAEPGFNPNNPRNDRRDMLVVVSDGAKVTQNYDGTTLGSYTETIGAIKNAPYSYVAYPRRGLTGHSLAIDPMQAANAVKYGLTAQTGMTFVEKNNALTPVTIKPGEVTEFWLMHVAKDANRYIEIVFSDWGRIKFEKRSASVWGHAKEKGNGTYTSLYTNPNWGGNAIEGMGLGKWNQFVVDGSQVDASTGVGTYIVYFNGTPIFSYAAVGKSRDSGFVYTHRIINPAGNADSNGYFVEDAKTYTLPTTVSNNVAVSEGGKVTVNGTDYTANGTVSGLYEGSTLNFTVTPDENKVIDKITYNGQELVNTMTSVTVVKDATLSVTFKDDPAVATPEIDLWTTSVTPGTLSGFSSHTVYGIVSGWKNIDGYGMKLSDGTEFTMLNGFMDGDAWTWLEESQGRFAFRVYGEGIVGKTCTMTPYITVDGSNTFGEASDEFTGSMAE